MKLRFFSIFALAGLLLSSCAVEEVPVTEHTILAVMEGDQTRTSVTDGGVFSWSAGDQVWLQTTNGSVPGTLSSGAGTSRASFSTGVFIGELTGKAVYPYNASHSISGDELSFVLPASYDLGSNLTNTNAAMYGVDVDGTIRFNHLAGVMRFVFRNAPVGTDKFQITLDKKINGIFTADLTEALPVIETSAASSQSEKTVTLNFDALNSVSDISLYVPLPVGTYTTLELEIWAGDKSLWSYSNTVTNKIDRKTLKLMPAVNMGTSVDGDIEGGDGNVEGGVADLSENGTANSYIVSSAGSYKFSTVKGNSSESVGAVSSAEVLWETFGTDVTPNVGDLVKNVKYADGTISFDTPSAFKEGNAVIAAKDASGAILWSWHIWLTDEPQGQEYYNNAGTMMDRNLGATSATPGDVGALGLLYQWGRKDPFLGSSEIKSGVVAKSTMIWPECTVSDASTGTIEYTISNPTIFITENKYNSDWWYYESEDMETDNTRWQPEKTIYDPCPSGWRVPDCANSGVWAMATGKDYDLYSSSYNPSYYQYEFDYSDNGVNFSNIFGSSLSIWYPAAGSLSDTDGSLGLYYTGIYWTCPGWTNSPWANPMSMGEYMIRLGTGFGRAGGFSVRCVKEGSQSSGDQPLASSASDLGTDGTANSYIVSKSGTYKFKPVKGNSSTSVGSVSSVEVLWESFGTDVTPNVGDLIKTVNYDAGYVVFATPSSFTRGNAVIAAKDASGKILWSWHIWLTDEPQGQVYYNNAGTMMDRNLGATSATPGDVGALGLLYQWGRKDPFLGSSNISDDVDAKSTITWPSHVSSDSNNGTIAYATANPTTFIKYNESNDDWYYTGSSSTDNTRWTTSESSKSIYDPCPAGWRVPDGGSNGVWSKSLGSSSDFDNSSSWDSTNEGMNFSGKFGSASTIWYPASGYRGRYDCSLNYVGGSGYYWSASPNNNYAFFLYLYDNGSVNPSNGNSRANGQAVRCIKE